MITKIMNRILIYLSFVWGIAWRTLAAGVLTAILVGVGVGVLSAQQSWPPETLNHIVSLTGMPITVLVLVFVAWDRGLALRDKLTSAPV